VTLAWLSRNERLGFVGEAPRELGLLAELRRNPLDGHQPLGAEKPSIHGTIDLAHAPLGNALDEAVTPQDDCSQLMNGLAV